MAHRSISWSARLVASLGFALCVLFVSRAAFARPNAKALESRLYAPCCYGGTLDIHDSELAHELRTEIEGRLDRGESAESIQADFVNRYGDKVLAASSDSPSEIIGVVALVAALAAAVALRASYRRWMAVPSEKTPAAVRSHHDHDVLDARLDAELAELDVEEHAAP